MTRPGRAHHAAREIIFDYLEGWWLRVRLCLLIGNSRIGSNELDGTG